MKLAICDDEKRIRDIIAESVKEVSEKIEIEFYNGEEMERLIDLLRSIR